MSLDSGQALPGFPGMDELPGAGRILIAFSGGPDSVCLAANLIARKAERPLLAIHVDHGLDEFSQERAVRAAELAAQLDLALQFEKLPALSGSNTEAAARHARYRRFGNHLGDDELLVTGHHADDQAETVLLRLLRGAGPQGLVGIPRQRRFGRGWIARPLLDYPRSTIISWLHHQGLEWQDDPSNTDLSKDRNFLRHRVFPLLESRWPGLRRSLGRSANLGLGAAEALEQLAQQDLTAAKTRWQSLDHDKLRGLSRYRQGQVLRYWYLEHQLEPPPARRIDDFLNQVDQAAIDRQPTLEWLGHRLCLWRGSLWLHRQHRVTESWRVVWSGKERLMLPSSLGRLELSSDGSTLRRPVVVRLGREGDRIRLKGRAGSHSVSKLLAEFGVPPWQRLLWPRLERDGQILAIGDQWVTGDFAAELENLSERLQWRTRPLELLTVQANG